MKSRLLAGAAIMMVLAGAYLHSYASEKGLPNIVAWENGRGLNENGSVIMDSWAYDTINPSGKYVLFGKSGEVLRKQEQMEEEDALDTNYTATEQYLGRFAIRCDVFPGFTGTVDVKIQERSGKLIDFSLGQKCRYEGNLFAGTGVYRILDASAQSGDFLYKVSYPDKEFDMDEGKILLIRMEVIKETENRIAETEMEDTKERQGIVSEASVPESEGEEETEIAEREVERGMPKKRIMILGSAMLAGLLGFTWLKKRKSKA